MESPRRSHHNRCRIGSSPPTNIMGYITEREVREEMRDRSASDHILLPDIAFTSEDIHSAMRSTARKFNSIAPYCITADPDHLSDFNNMFFDGIAATLLGRMLLNTSMNDMDYTAGNVQASVSGTFIKNVAPLVATYEKRFIELATQYKTAANLAQAFGQIG